MKRPSFGPGSVDDSIRIPPSTILSSVFPRQANSTHVIEVHEWEKPYGTRVLYFFSDEESALKYARIYGSCSRGYVPVLTIAMFDRLENYLNDKT